VGPGRPRGPALPTIGRASTQYERPHRMSATALFLGVEILVWLGIGLSVWTAVSFHYRPRASFRAMAAALVAALVGGPLPGLLGWRSLGGLLCGLALAAVGSTLAAWQTMVRVRSE